MILRGLLTKATSGFAFGALAILLLAPIGALLLSWTNIFSDDSGSWAILKNMLQTVLPGYARDTALLCVIVALLAGAMGTSCATLVSLFDFRGRRTLEWALLLPLAMPAYVVAYAYTDFLQFGGLLQTWLRATFELEGRLIPEIRSLWGAALVFSVCLYPYVYLLARTALSERAVHLMEAAKLLGNPLGSRLWRIALPLARPAIAAGIALVLMETLADFGVVSYFGVQTFSAGVYKAWLAMDNRIAAAQLATTLLIVVLGLIKVEQAAQKRMRFASTKGSNKSAQSAAPLRLHGIKALSAGLLCALPILFGFVVPVGLMLVTFWTQWHGDAMPLEWQAFIQWSWNSFRLAAITAVIAVSLGLWLAFSQRLASNQWIRKLVQIASLGYAVPGTVIVVGLLLPIAWFQTAFPRFNAGYWLTATSLGLVWAYLIRFNAVAIHSLQSGYSRIPNSIDESARMLGAHRFSLLRDLHAPLLKRSLLTAALLVFVDVMKELPATLVLRPFNSDTLAVMTYQLARDERLGEASLPALALVLVGLIPVILLSRTLSK